MRPNNVDIHEYARPDQDRARIIVVGVPTFGMVSVRWHVCQLGLKAPMNVPMSMSTVIGQEVGVARNEIVARALTLEDPTTRLRASHVFFVDDDCLLSESALQQLYAHHQPIMAGLYYSKSTPPYPLILPDKHGGTAHGFTHGDLMPCYAHGMGCTLIDLDVFRTMHAAGVAEETSEPCSQCQGDGCAGCCGTGHMIRWFHTIRDETEQTPNGPKFSSQTEDVYFCERAAAAGFQPCVDTGVFAFHYDKRSGEAYPLEQWRQYRETGLISWPEAVPA